MNMFSALPTLSHLQQTVRLELEHLPTTPSMEPFSFVVACSGGADSMALSIILGTLHIPCVIAHMNHGLRDNAKEDAQAVSALAKRLNLPCQIEYADVQGFAREQQCGIEEAGRIIRYRFFENVRQEHNCRWIALAHQADDLTEDVLMRLIRGTGWPALAGMQAVDLKRRLIRPLLHVPRTHIEQCLKEINIVWQDDPSNATDAFRRNRIRHHILPVLKKENPAIHRSIKQLWMMAREDESYWNTLLDPVLAQTETYTHGLRLQETKILCLPRAARLRLYHRLVQHMAQTHGGQGRAEIFFQIDNAIQRQQRPKQWRLAGGLILRLQHGFLWIDFDKNRVL